MARRQSPRDRRLASDFAAIQKLNQESSIFSFEAVGNPPRRYLMKFHGAGLSRNSSDRVRIHRQHEVLVDLGAAYPRMIPNLVWQTPIFHPNISNNGGVCLGSYGTHWVPSLTLDELCTMLWDMIRYKNFDIDSPYNRVAARWARRKKHFEFPIDPRSIRDRVTANQKRHIHSKPKQKPELQKPVEAILVQTQTPGASLALASEASPEIEIVETGIEIINSNLSSPLEDGIQFLD